MRTVFLYALAFSLTACQDFASTQHAQELSSNRVDDDYCVSHGLRYPDPGYVQCRRNLIDTRLYRAWKSTQLMKQATQPGSSGAPSATIIGQESYRPLDPQSFHCLKEPQFGNDYVFCGYDSGEGL